MAESKSKSRKSKPAAAVAEKSEQKGKQKGSETIEWRGHSFKLPASPPRSIAFRMAELEEAGNDSRPLLKLLKSLLDAGEPGQYAVVVREIDAAGDDEGDEVIVSAYGLVDEIFKALYGVDEGESEASQDS